MLKLRAVGYFGDWIPAFAGMTRECKNDACVLRHPRRRGIFLIEFCDAPNLSRFVTAQPKTVEADFKVKDFFSIVDLRCVANHEVLWLGAYRATSSLSQCPL